MIHDLLGLNETWSRAWLERDDATVDRLMTDDYVYVAPNGQILDRRRILEVIRSPTYSIVHGTCTEVTVRMLGSEAGLIRRRWQGEVNFEGSTYQEDHRVVMVCARPAGEWRIAFEQAAAIHTGS
jgi:hypothetical protein